MKLVHLIFNERTGVVEVLILSEHDIYSCITSSRVTKYYLTIEVLTYGILIDLILTVYTPRGRYRKIKTE